MGRRGWGGEGKARTGRGKEGPTSKEGKGRAGEGGEGREGVRRGGEGKGRERKGRGGARACPPTHNFWVCHWLTAEADELLTNKIQNDKSSKSTKFNAVMFAERESL